MRAGEINEILESVGYLASVDLYPKIRLKSAPLITRPRSLRCNSVQPSPTKSWALFPRLNGKESYDWKAYGNRPSFSAEEVLLSGEV